MCLVCETVIVQQLRLPALWCDVAQVSRGEARLFLCPVVLFQLSRHTDLSCGWVNSYVHGWLFLSASVLKPRHITVEEISEIKSDTSKSNTKLTNQGPVLPCGGRLEQKAFHASVVWPWAQVMGWDE